MEIGTKIRKIREIKGLSQENMAEELGMSVTGYGKIERNEVSVNVERLQQIATVFKVGVEQIIGFEDNIAFNNFNSTVEWQVGHYVMPVEMKKLYDDKIALMEEKIQFLTEENARLKRENNKEPLSDEELIKKYGDKVAKGAKDLIKLGSVVKERTRKGS